MRIEGKAGTSSLKVVVGKHKRNSREACSAFMCEFRRAYRTQQPNASSADVMRAVRREWRIMSEEVMRDEVEWRNMREEEKAPVKKAGQRTLNHDEPKAISDKEKAPVKKAGQRTLDHDEPKAISDKGSYKAVNKEAEKTKTKATVRKEPNPE